MRLISLGAAILLVMLMLGLFYVPVRAGAWYMSPLNVGVIGVGAILYVYWETQTYLRRRHQIKAQRADKFLYVILTAITPASVVVATVFPRKVLGAMGLDWSAQCIWFIAIAAGLLSLGTTLLRESLFKNTNVDSG